MKDEKAIKKILKRFMQMHIQNAHAELDQISKIGLLCKDSRRLNIINYLNN